MKQFSYKLLLVLLLVIVSSSLVSAVYLPRVAPDIEVNLLSQDPDPVKAGDVVEVRFKIENNGTQTLDNVIIEILPEYPLGLYSGSLMKDLGRLQASQTGADSVIVDYKLRVDENAVEGDTEIDLKVSVGDLELFIENSFFIDIEEHDQPKIRAYVRESSILEVGEKGTVVIEIANTDIGNARFVDLTLLPSDGYQILSRSNYVYLGDIDSDDTESEEFEIYITPDADQEILLPILINYQDTNEQEYQNEFNLKLRLFSSQELFQFGLKERNYSLFIFIFVILVSVILIFWYKIRKKK